MLHKSIKVIFRAAVTQRFPDQRNDCSVSGFSTSYMWKHPLVKLFKPQLPLKRDSQRWGQGLPAGLENTERGKLNAFYNQKEFTIAHFIQKRIIQNYKFKVNQNQWVQMALQSRFTPVRVACFPHLQPFLLYPLSSPVSLKAWKVPKSYTKRCYKTETVFSIRHIFVATSSLRWLRQENDSVMPEQNI